MSYYKQAIMRSQAIISDVHPDLCNSPFVVDAAFYEAYCYYLSSPKPELDQTNTYQALDALRLFMVRYRKARMQRNARNILPSCVTN